MVEDNVRKRPFSKCLFRPTTAIRVANESVTKVALYFE